MASEVKKREAYEEAQDRKVVAELRSWASFRTKPLTVMPAFNALIDLKRESGRGVCQAG
jgi:hypothetical protein